MGQKHRVDRRAVPDVLAALAVLALGGVTATAGGLLLGQAVIRPAAPALEVALGMAAAVVGVGITLWWLACLMVTTVLGIHAARTHGRLDAGIEGSPGMLSPAFMRRLVTVLLSGHLLAGALATGVTTTAVAAPAISVTAHPSVGTVAGHEMRALARGAVAPGTASIGAPLARGPVAVAADVRPPAPAVDPSFVPSAPAISDGSLLVRRPHRASAASTEATTTVVPGDSLWTIAARQLGPLATDLEIARQWPRWYALNREEIGPNPDVLAPGQQLRTPRVVSPDATG